MYAIKRIVLGLTAATLLVGPALALTISNRDTSEYQIQVTQGDQTAERSLGAGAVLEEACEEGCVLRLADSDVEFEAKGDDALMIKGGQIQKDAAE